VVSSEELLQACPEHGVPKAFAPLCGLVLWPVTITQVGREWSTEMQPKTFRRAEAEAMREYVVLSLASSVKVLLTSRLRVRSLGSQHP
jgi:hypothetical protein